MRLIKQGKQKDFSFMHIDIDTTAGDTPTHKPHTHIVIAAVILGGLTGSIAYACWHFY